MQFICRNCRVLLQRIPAVVRRHHLWLPPSSSLTSLPEDIPEEVTHLSIGVGFSVAYGPQRSNGLWLLGDNSPILHGRSTLQLPSGNVKEVAAGRAHVVALATTGKAYSFGMNCYGQCGVPETQEQLSILNLVRGIPGEITKVSCGLDHSLFLNSEGKVFTCGWSADGQTGIGHYESCAQPTEVRGVISRCKVSSIHTCADSSFALTDSGEVYAWGNNEYGQLAVETPVPQVCIPVVVDCCGLDGQVVSIATGGAFTAFLTSTGSVYCTGYGIGDDTASTGLDPHYLCRFRRLPVPAVSIHAGLHYLAIRTLEDEILVWGRNPSSSQYNTTSPIKVQVPFLAARNIAFGADRMMSLVA